MPLQCPFRLSLPRCLRLSTERTMKRAQARAPASDSTRPLLIIPVAAPLPVSASFLGEGAWVVVFEDGQTLLDGLECLSIHDLIIPRGFRQEILQGLRHGGK